MILMVFPTLTVVWFSVYLLRVLHWCADGEINETTEDTTGIDLEMWNYLFLKKKKKKKKKAQQKFDPSFLQPEQRKNQNHY